MPSGLQEFDKAFVLMKKEKAGAGFFLQAHSAMTERTNAVSFAYPGNGADISGAGGGYLESGNVKTDEEGPTASSSATVSFVVRRCRMLTQQSKLKQPGTNEYPPSCLRFKIVVHIGWECRVTLVRNPASDRIGQGTLHQAFRLEKNMNKILALLTFLILTAYALGQGSAPGTAAAGQQPTTSSASESAQLQQGSLIYAELSKPIDSKKAKVGDPVAAKVTQAVLSRGKVVIPKGTKIVGHVTAVQSRGKDQHQSQLGLAFDRAELKDGTQIPLVSLTIQAMESMQAMYQQGPGMGNGGNGSEPSIKGPGAPGSGGSGKSGGMNSPMRGSTYPTPNAGAGTDVGTNDASGSPTNAGLNASSHGVMGMSGVTLQSTPQGGTVSSEGKNV